MLRYRFNRVTLPICLSVMLSLAAATALVGAFIKPMLWAILPFSLFVASLIALVAIMLTLNLLVTPAYMGAPRSAVIDMIPTLLLPFNASKGVVNAALVLILYKPVRQAMQAAKLMPKSTAAKAQPAHDPTEKKKRILRSVCVTACGVLLLAVVLILFMTLLHGNLSWVGKFTWFENFKGLFGDPSGVQLYFRGYFS